MIDSLWSISRTSQENRDVSKFYDFLAQAGSIYRYYQILIVLFPQLFVARNGSYISPKDDLALILR